MCVLKRIIQCFVIFYLCIVFSCYGSSGFECSSPSQFYTIDTFGMQPYPFCTGIFKEIDPLNFQIVPFYMQSFLYPKLFVMHSSRNLKLIPESDSYVSRDFESMMAKQKENNMKLSLKSYGITCYGIHRNNVNSFDNICVYYERNGQCLKECLPIPALRHPKVKADKGNVVAEFNVRKAKGGDLNSATRIDYFEQNETLDVVKLQELISKDISVVSPQLNENHEFDDVITCANESNVANTPHDPQGKCNSTNIKCLKGLNYLGLGYYLRKYDETIGGHRYFWMRKNKRKLVRHRYTNNGYAICDDSMSYDLDNITMRSFLSSIVIHDNYYFIPNTEYNIAEYKGSKEADLCRNSQLYFDSTTVLKRIYHDKECIFGKIQYSYDEEGHIKNCKYNYVSDDFETFGLNRNKSELENADFFLVYNNSLHGLTQRDQYLEEMCVDKFPQYEYRVKRHMNGLQRNRYVYRIGDHADKHFYKCDFIKIEAWGGGQAGYIENGTAYSGSAGHYTFGILKMNDQDIKEKKLMIHVGEGGRYPGEYGGDTVVSLCDSTGNDCKISLVARGCTHNLCKKNNSFIDDSIVMHYRSATGMDFSEHKPIWLQNNRPIPWGNRDFPDGIVRLGPDDCAGPANAFEKNPNEYPGAGGCAKFQKSIQQGADGLVRLTCEVWNKPIKETRQDRRRYSYNKEQNLLCNKKEKSIYTKGECLKSVCIYSSNDEKLSFSSQPVTMFGEEQCEAIKQPINGLIVGLINAGNVINLNFKSDIYSGKKKYCYDSGVKLDLVTHIYRSFLLRKSILQSNGGYNVNDRQCWNDNEHAHLTLSCYRSNSPYLKVSNNEYICCYHDIRDKGHFKDVCWKTTGETILKEFSNYDLPNDLPIELRQNFYDGSMALLDSLNKKQISIKPAVAKKKSKKRIPNNNGTIENPQYAYSKRKEAFCLNYEKNEKGCLKSVCTYTLSGNNTISDHIISYVSSTGGDMCPSIDAVRNNQILNKNISTKVSISCDVTGKCCYSNDNKESVKGVSQELSNENTTDTQEQNSKRVCWSSADNPSLLCYEGGNGNTNNSNGKTYTCCYDDLDNYKAEYSKDTSKIPVCWNVDEFEISKMFDEELLNDLVGFNVKDLLNQIKQESNNNDVSDVKQDMYIQKELQYAYYPDENTFCLDTTDRKGNPVGCLMAACIYSNNENSNADYQVLKKNGNSLCPTIPKLGSFIPSYGPNHIVSCKDDQCCYSNYEKIGNPLCLPDGDVTLSCYKDTSGIQNQSKDYNYICCYSSVNSSTASERENNICWKAGKEIWQILGYYKLSEESKKIVAEEHKNTKKYGKIIIKKNKLNSHL